MKFVILFLIFAFATIQVFQTIDAQSTENDVNDFYSTLKTLIEKYKILLYVAGNHIPEFLKDMKETTIREHIPELVTSLFEKAQQLAKDNSHCFEDNKFNLLGLYVCLMEQMKSSGEDAAIEELKEEIKSLVVVAKELAMNVTQAIGADGDM